jgi:hypothetical protein
MDFKQPKRGFFLLSEGVELTSDLAAELVSCCHKFDLPFERRDEFFQLLEVNVFVLPLPALISNTALFYLCIQGHTVKRPIVIMKRVSHLIKIDTKPILPNEIGKIIEVLSRFIDRKPNRGW